MKNWKVKFSNSTVEFVLDGKFANIAKMVDKANAIYITDENVYALHQQIFKGKPTIVIPAGEIHKQQATVDFIIEALLNFGANRQSVLIGVGGRCGHGYRRLCGWCIYAWCSIWICSNNPIGDGRCCYWRKKWHRCGRL